MEDKKIQVTKPSLPELKGFIPYLNEIWKSKWLTNNGKYHQEFEKSLAEFLGVQYISLVSNGTLGLMLALKALEIEGEVITTPYSFVATANSIIWSNVKPIFCDIDYRTFNIDANKIEELITYKTKAIMPVHVYGNPCDVKSIEKIAKKYNLNVIYDAAHAFNVKINNIPIISFGDISVLSFHATKIFNTFEGGAIACGSNELKRKIDILKNFGFVDEESVITPGINAKMNELQSIIGLLQLNNVEDIIDKCKTIAKAYRNLLENVKGIDFLKEFNGIKYNYSYFPILIDKKKFGMSRDELFNKLKQNNIYTRKYFYPLITKYYAYSNTRWNDKKFPVAEEISKKVLCLPIYEDLEIKDVKRIVEIINYAF